VTHGKAWVEMTHRYLATGVGVLITVLALASWLAWRHDRAAEVSPWWATTTLIWVCVQGAFGALTVTMKLYPAIVTAHLLGGMALLALLAAQAQAHQRIALSVPPALWRGVLLVCALGAVQIALGGWVSTNYAVLACSDFPMCQGSWWPTMNLEQGFALQRELGRTSDGAWLPFEALTTIHYVHRLFAYVLIAALCLLAWRLHLAADVTGAEALRPWPWSLVCVAVWQLATGLSNVILGWPLAAALAHTAGAAMMVMLMAALVVRMHAGRHSVAAQRAFAAPARTTP
jgi:cytochrome c oxidase assembly protein subunit 15